MRKTGILSLLLLLVQISFSQSDSTSYQQLLQQFTNLYKTSRAASESNYITQLNDAASNSVRINNPLFFASLKELNKFYPGRDIEWSIQKLTDSLIYATVKEQLWTGMEELMVKSKPAMELYNTRLCECISAQIKSEKDYNNLLKTVQECVGAMGKDPLFANRIAVSTISLTMEEKLQLSKNVIRYTYQNCPALYTAMNDVVIDDVVGHYYNDLDAFTGSLDKRITALWKARKTDSLLLLFPAYKKAEADLVKTSELIEKESSSITTKKQSNGLTTVTKTFALDTKPVRLLGQVVYTYSVNETLVKVHSLRFIPSERIPNRKLLLDELNDVPPPMQIVPVKD